MKTKPVNKLLVAVSAAFGLANGYPAAMAVTPRVFDNVIGFGDSLNDSGNDSLLVAPAFNPPQKFTTNPGLTTFENVANALGHPLLPSLQGGENYAYGGSGIIYNASDSYDVPTITKQVSDFLTSHPRLDSKTLYMVWGGANDIANITDYRRGTQAELQARVAASARQEISLIGNLQSAGAKNVLVFNLPDLGKTPDALEKGTAYMAEQTAFTKTFNDQLNAGLGKLGKGVVPVNVYALFNQLISDPARFGITNITSAACVSKLPTIPASGNSLGCGPQGAKLNAPVEFDGKQFGVPLKLSLDDYLSHYAPGANDTYVFADFEHPTTVTHALLAQVVLSELAAPPKISLLGEAPLAASTAQTSAARKQMLADSLGADSRFFADVNYSRQRFDGNQNTGVGSPRTISNNVDLTVGGDWRINDYLSAGGALGIGHHQADFTGGGGYTLRDYSALAYLDYHAGGGYAGVYAITGRSRFSDIERNIQIGPAVFKESGDADGSHTGAGIHGGWWFGDEGFKTGPYANLEWQNISVEGFHEDGGDATAMWFGAQRRKALIGTLGWRLQGDWQVGSTTLTPYATLAWNHDSKANPRMITAGLNTMNGSFTLAGYVPDKNWGSAEVGLGAQFSPRVSGWLGYDGRFSDASQRFNSLNAGLKIAL